MAEVRETHVERDADGRVTDTKVVIERPKKRGGFGWGMLLGVLLIAAAVLGFSYSRGSFQQAGVEANQVAAQVEQQTQETVANETSDTATN